MSEREEFEKSFGEMMELSSAEMVWQPERRCYQDLAVHWAWKSWQLVSEKTSVHDSDCSMHNEPAYPNGPCDCSVSQFQRGSPASSHGTQGNLSETGGSDGSPTTLHQVREQAALLAGASDEAFIRWAEMQNETAGNRMSGDDWITGASDMQPAWDAALKWRAAIAQVAPMAGAEPPKQGEASGVSIRCRKLADEVWDTLAQTDQGTGWDEDQVGEIQSKLLPGVYDLLSLLAIAAAPSVEPAPEQKKAHHEDGLGQSYVAHESSFTPQADSKPKGPPFYVGGPYLDGAFAVCDLITGRVLRMFRGEDDLLLAAGTKTVNVGLQSFSMTDCAPAPHQEPGWVMHIAGPDDLHYFIDEFDALRAANTINQMYLADRLKNPDNEVLCVATVVPKEPKP